MLRKSPCFVCGLLVAVVPGEILGYERERAGAAAGFRTPMLVALGSTLFLPVPLQAGTDISDINRVPQGVAAGIGFPGAGAMLKSSDKREVRGLTTAASIWLAAAVGVSAGMGGSDSSAELVVCIADPASAPDSVA